MIAVDTNVLVRLIVGDDPEQARVALELAEREPFYVSLTVLEELEWVLRSRFGYDRGRIVQALDALDALVRLVFEAEHDVRWAIERYALAGELADYLHLAAARSVGRFASFERKLARRAGVNSPATVITLA